MRSKAATAIGVNNAGQDELGGPVSGERKWSSITRQRTLLGLLVVIYAFNFIDRVIVAVVGQSLRAEFGLSDLQLGLLSGTAFAIFYSIVGLPMARLAERGNRTHIIAGAVILWSAATMACSAARSFTHLLVARIGVGIGEGGLTPAVISLISDYFPPNRRASAYSFVVLGLPIGSVAGAFGGGWIAEHYGWRTAFLVAGAPGVVLGLIALWLLREPSRGQFDGRATGDDGVAPSFVACLRTVFSKSSFIYLGLGTSLSNATNYAMNLFLVLYLVRRFEMDLATAGSVFAFIIGGAAVLGALVGGPLLDRVSQRDVRYYAWIPAVSLILAWALFCAALLQSNWMIAAGLFLIAGIAMFGFSPPTIATTQGLVPPRMRASSAAIIAITSTLLGLGLGPVVVGWASDMFASAAFSIHGDYVAHCLHAPANAIAACAPAAAIGLKKALLISSLALPLAALSYLLATRTLKHDLYSDYGLQSGDPIR